VLAFVASLIALNISRIREEKQRQRDFLASRAFLPAAFSELSTYFSASANFLSAVWVSGSTGASAPAQVGTYRSVFLDCIRHSTPEVGEYLSEILVQLQVHESRLDELSHDRSLASDRHTLVSYMLGLGKLKVLVDRQYDFARGRQAFDALPATLEDFQNAYRILNLHQGDYVVSENFSLQSVTVRYVARTYGTTDGSRSLIRNWLSRLRPETS
jgi:hypothetical protein